MPRTSCTLILGLLPALLAGAAAAELSSVVLPYGEVQGNLLESVDEFLGIPYAKPPLGGRRFAPPEPWAERYPGGRLAATRAGASCMQTTLEFPSLWFLPTLTTVSEDCLFLNVYRPRAASRASPSSNRTGRPVMLWIHGGALQAGAGSMPAYNATDLAAREDVVVVTINYRLNVFGFSPTIGSGGAAVANNGWRDQREAMRWVQRHIAAFGGDPGRVTLFGESAGGQSAMAHLLSPGSAGLFGGVISESGDITSQRSLKAGLETTALIAKRVGCAGPADLPCLRNASAASLVAASVKTWVTSVVDGDFLPAPVLELLAEGRFDKGVPVIMGWNLLDAELFSYPGFHFPSNSTGILSKEQTECVFRRSFKEHAQRLMDVYPPRRTWGVFDNRGLISSLATDLVFGCPASGSAGALASKGASAWVFSFRRKPSCSPSVFPGPVHGAEIAYVFGNQKEMASVMPCRVSPQDEALSRTVMQLWGTFARQGAPPVEWPRWDADKDTVLKLELSSPSKLSTETGFRRGQCEALRSAGLKAEDGLELLGTSLVECQGSRRLAAGAEEAPAVFV